MSTAVDISALRVKHCHIHTVLVEVLINMDCRWQIVGIGASEVN